MLVKFMLHPVGLVADIEKAFLMVGVNEKDRDMLRFLWLKNIKDPDPEIVKLRFCRLVFGLRPSPAILGATIKHHLETCKQQNPEIVECLEDSLYVDDFVSGAEDDEKAFKVCKGTREIMSTGGFDLRKWHSNSSTLVQSINNLESNVTTSSFDEETGVVEDDLSFAKSTIGQQPTTGETQVKVLGVIWDTSTDTFSFELVEYAKSLPVTKRSFLKWSSKIFDPLGYLTPFTIKLKSFFQELCMDKMDWDDELQDGACKQWNVLISELASLNEVQVPRCYFLPELKPVVVQIHGFSDASGHAFAAVVYLRIVYENGNIDVNLIASKTKVAPAKKQTIPRLELLGATILARLVNTVSKALGLDVETFYWVDSTTALHWIKNERSWKQYVHNRVNEIKSLSSPEAWRFCPGTLNPADLPSRGISGKELASETLWFKGPKFLVQHENEWPICPVNNLNENDQALREVVKQPQNLVRSLHVSANKSSRPGLNLSKIFDMDRFGNLRKLLRVTAYLLKFVNALKSSKRGEQSSVKGTSKRLIASEIEQAEILWLRSIQEESFAKEIGFLSARNSNLSAPTYVKQFGLFLDGDCVLRCKGRLNNSSLALSSRNPILLPSKHRFVELLIREIHYKIKHNGIRDTLTTIRERFWILRGREAVKKSLKKCVVCRKFEGPPYEAETPPDLPASRVSEDPPFTNVGLDFAGPLYVQEIQNNMSESSSKVYVLLFTCASTRAIHLELTLSLSVQSFLRAFRRFVSRRGLPALIISDNAKTFRASSKEISRLCRAEEVWRYLTDNRITWDFIVERAPWWGGFWERLIQSVKRPLKKVIGRTNLNYDELQTLLVEIESLVNARPLTYIYDDAESISFPLTPSHLIYGRRITNMPNSQHYEIVSTHKSLT